MSDEKPSPKPRHRKDAAVFLYPQVIALPAELPGPDGAAVTAAEHAGYRLAGAPYVESQEDHPDHVVLTWAVPVEAA